MPNFIESPDSSQYPEKSKKITPIIDTLVIRTFADVILTYFKKSYVSPEGKFASVVYNISEDVQNFVNLAEKTGNLLFITELLRILREIDQLPIAPDHQYVWEKQQLDIDETVQYLTNSEIWLAFVSLYDDAELHPITRSFSEKYDRRFAAKEDLVKSSLAKGYAKVFEVDGEISYEQDRKNSKPLKLNALSLESLAGMVLKSDSLSEVEHFLNLHFDQTIVSPEFTYKEPRFRSGVEMVMEYMQYLSPDALDKYIGEFASKENPFLEFVAANLTDNWRVVWQLCQDNQEFDSYKAYQLEILAMLVTDLDNDTSEDEIPEAELVQIKQFLISQIKKLPIADKLGPLSTFLHPDLIADDVDSLIYEYQERFSSSLDFTDVLFYVMEHASEVQKDAIKNVVNGYLEKDLTSLESETPFDDEDDEDDQFRSSFNPDRMEIAGIVGSLTQDTQMVANVFTTAYAEFSQTRGKSWKVKEILIQLTPFLMQFGDEPMTQDLIEKCTECYQHMEALILSTSAYLNNEALAFVVNSIPLMVTIFDSLQQHFPNSVIELVDDADEEDGARFDMTVMNQKLVEFYSWMSQGLEVRSISGLDLKESPTDTLDFAGLLHLHKNEPELLKVLKMTLLTEATRLLQSGDLYAADSYLQAIVQRVGSESVDDKDMWPFLSQEKFKWIVEKIFPQAFPLLISSVN